MSIAGHIASPQLHLNPQSTGNLRSLQAQWNKEVEEVYSDICQEVEGRERDLWIGLFLIWLQELGDSEVSPVGYSSLHAAFTPASFTQSFFCFSHTLPSPCCPSLRLSLWDIFQASKALVSPHVHVKSPAGMHSTLESPPLHLHKEPQQTPPRS